MTAGNLPPDDVPARIRRLRRLRQVPDEVLTELVATQGLIRRRLDEQTLTAAARAPDPDRELARALCAGCPVQDECLELDLRWMADRTVGVFAGLTESDRRAVHAVWATERPGQAAAEHAAPDLANS